MEYTNVDDTTDALEARWGDPARWYEDDLDTPDDGPALGPLDEAARTVELFAAIDAAEALVRDNGGPAYPAPRAPAHLRLPALRACALLIHSADGVCEHLRHGTLAPAFSWSFWPERVMCADCVDDAGLDPAGPFSCHECGAPTEGAVAVVGAYVVWIAPLCDTHLAPHAAARLPRARGAA